MPWRLRLLCLRLKPPSARLPIHSFILPCNLKPIIQHRRYVNGPSQKSPDPSPSVIPVDSPAFDETKDSKKFQKIPKGAWKLTAFKMGEAALTTFATIAILGLAGYTYTVYYKRMVLNKIENAFAPGDPVLDLAFRDKRTLNLADLSVDIEEQRETPHWIQRPEQEVINQTVNGTNHDHYWLCIGEKGTGKSSMLLKAMKQIDGDGVAWIESHPDIEIFRLKLGRALDFDYHEDNIGSFFSIRGPRDASALLDIERAFNKLEKVALKRRRAVGKPLILIFNNIHLIKEDEVGESLLQLIQHRAETWAAANLITVVLNSDDYWIYERLKNFGSRLRILPVKDLTKSSTITALTSYRQHYFNEVPSQILLEQVYSKIGGRLSFLDRVAKEQDMLLACEEIERSEKTWLLNKCWVLGTEMDDDVMDQQKNASSALVLVKAMVDAEGIEQATHDDEGNIILPTFPLHKACQIMTRVDFIQNHDRNNIFTVDAYGMVRADNVPMMNAFRSVCNEPGFAEFLDQTLQRISDIESLGRTREIYMKDLRLGNYRFKMESGKTVEMAFVEKEDQDDDKKSRLM